MKTNLEKLQKFISDEEILDIMIKYNDMKKVEACRQLQNSLLYTWTITVSEAMGILQNINKEF